MAHVIVQVNGRPYTMQCPDGEEAHLRDLAKLLAAPMPGKGQTVEVAVKDAIATIGENMNVRRTAALSVGRIRLRRKAETASRWNCWRNVMLWLASKRKMTSRG